MDWLARLFRRDGPPPPASVAWCPRCGAELKPYWAEDDIVTTLGIGGDRGLPSGDHLVLRVECECGFASRANNIRVLDPSQLARVG